jgi:hypothetical protein
MVVHERNSKIEAAAETMRALTLYDFIRFQLSEIGDFLPEEEMLPETRAFGLAPL